MQCELNVASDERAGASGLGLTFPTVSRPLYLASRSSFTSFSNARLMFASVPSVTTPPYPLLFSSCDSLHAFTLLCSSSSICAIAMLTQRILLSVFRMASNLGEKKLVAQSFNGSSHALSSPKKWLSAFTPAFVFRPSSFNISIFAPAELAHSSLVLARTCVGHTTTSPFPSKEGIPHTTATPTAAQCSSNTSHR